MRVLIIEDEKVAADRLEKLLQEINPQYQIAAKLGSIKESVSWLMNQTADLIFLDIQLSDGLSFSIFKQVPVNIPIIFTTAYDQYSIKAFQLNSISYLLKPIRKDDLVESLEKYKKMKAAFSINFESLHPMLTGQQQPYKKRFLVSYGEKIHKVETSEIAYFYAMDKSVFLTTFTNKSYPVEYSLDKLEELLNPEHYFRINRKYIINMAAIDKMYAWSRGRVKLVLTPTTEDDKDSLVSIERSTRFKEWLNS
ncbi:LytR/AlgR family response regulator transcription factor [Sunxiuqinia indica]|uniref:LytR/AlgR family response regulator transcription factor n=1 Tax=Sunxiuqinia indica TaxID=2692584 RepID=UPI001357CCE5|nr:LytTR family DNA-binding domain-containing protein [Sunxiuqinia indica]